MGTSNFKGCGKFGIYAFIYQYDKDWYEEEYPDLTDREREEVFEDDAHWMYDDVSSTVRKKIEDFNYDLVFYKLELSSGYYEGIEVTLKEEPDDEDIETLSDILQEARGYWNHPDVRMTERHKRNVQRIYDKECEMIEEFLENLCKEDGFSNYGIVARFSNGETWYRAASNGQQVSGPLDAVADFYTNSFSKRGSFLSRLKSKLAGIRAK